MDIEIHGKLTAVSPGPPPVGVVPKHLWDELTRGEGAICKYAVDEARYEEIWAAIDRYEKAGLSAPAEWREEARAILDQYTCMSD